MSASDDPSKASKDREWLNVADKEERRRIQNRDAQRRHRDRRRQEDEEKQRIATNQQAAGTAYTPAKLQDTDLAIPEGLPWGAFKLSSKEITTGTASSSRSSPELVMKKRKASDDDLSFSWRRDSSVDRAGPSRGLEVPRLFSRSLALSTSTPQLREVAMQQLDGRRSSSVRSRFRRGVSPGRQWPEIQYNDEI